MKKLLASTALFALIASVGTAQEYYGTIGLTGQSNHVDNILNDPAVGDPTNEPFDFSQFGISASVGRNFTNGYYGQIDLRYQDTDVPANTDDTLHNGSMIAFRVGKDFTNSRFGGFVGYVDVTGDDTAGSNKMQRVILGIDGEYSINSQISVFGEIGSIGEPMGTQGTDGDDGIHDGTYGIAGLSYSISPALSVDGQVGFANGTHDGDQLDMMIAGVGAYYETNVHGLSTYLRVDYTDFYQIGEDERLASTTVQLGIVYNFGSQGTSSRRPRALAPIEDWLGYSGGHLE